MPKGKILLMTYYWPPAGGVAVQRWYNMANYLAERGWYITVLVPKNPAYDVVVNDAMVSHPAIQVIAVPIFEINAWYKKITGQKTTNRKIFEDKSNGFKKLSLWIRANAFIPDARMFWIRPLAKAASQLMQTQNFDFIISNGTPHSVHLAAKRVKQTFPDLTWIADFRDPWLEIDYFNDLPLIPWARRRHQQLEQSVLQHADVVTTVSPSWKRLFESKGAKHVEVFTNGYNEGIHAIENYVPEQPFIIRHLGTIDSDRIPYNLFKSLQSSDSLRLELIGAVTPNIQKDLGQHPNVSVHQPVTYQEAADIMMTSDALLLLNNQVGHVAGRIPAKVFDYMASGRPIIYIGSHNNDAYHLLQQQVPHQLLAFSYEDQVEPREITQFIRHYSSEHGRNIEPFSRRNISQQFSKFLEQEWEKRK